MKLNKTIVFLILLSLLAATIIISLWNINRRTANSSLEFSELIEYASRLDLSLTIYYMSPFILTPAPVSNTDLINREYEYRVTINGIRFKKHFDLLNQISNIILVPVEGDYRDSDARIYYVFETGNDGKKLRVSMLGQDNSMFVNGRKVNESAILYDVAMRFLPEDAVKELHTLLNGMKSSLQN